MMKGYLYHNIVLSRANLIMMAVIEGFLVAAWIAYVVLMHHANEMDMTSATFVGGIILFGSLLSTELVSMDLFKNCEGDLWCSFAIASPASVEGYLGAKYKILFAIDLMLPALWLVVDAILGAWYEQTLAMASTAFLLCCLLLLLQSLELAVAVRLGGSFGSYVKAVVFALMMLGAVVYGLFGDLSFFRQEDPLSALQEAVFSGKTFLCLGCLPYIALVAYWLSYRYSVAVYRKGVIHYEG